MFRLLLLMVLVLLANNTYAQGGDIDDALKSIDTGDRRTVDTDFLSEKGGSGFNPQDVLDEVPSSRIRKKITETEKTKKDHTSRMAKGCTCALFGIAPYPFGDLCLEARKRGAPPPSRAEEKRDAAARRRRKSLCVRWWRDKDAGRGAYEKELGALEVRLEQELAIEERLKQQRRQRKADEVRMREEQVAAEKARREQLRQRAESERRESEALKLAWCQERWSRGANPCGCGGLPGAPAWAKTSSTFSTCGK